jgi:D-beta-D-heptose 7-phosphate kinase/D-beta-D-heptose 1-phosphate adenosyltransferase
MIPGLTNNRKPNIIVCGDIMLDINTFVDIVKIANEAPIPVYNFTSTEYKLGGCGNVMQNLYNIGCENICIFGSIGNDDNGNHIKNIISNMNVHSYIQTVEGVHTVSKHRYYCNNKIIFRCDNENNHSEKKS